MKLNSTDDLISTIRQFSWNNDFVNLNFMGRIEIFLKHKTADLSLKPDAIPLKGGNNPYKCRHSR